MTLQEQIFKKILIFLYTVLLSNGYEPFKILSYSYREVCWWHQVAQPITDKYMQECKNDSSWSRVVGIW